MTTSDVNAPVDIRQIDLTRPRAERIEFSANQMTIYLKDGRILSYPLQWFPRLYNATPEQRRQYILSGDGKGMHWEELDEDISVPGMFGLPT